MLVEAALILPVLMILVFGIIEIGLLIDSATVTSNASRSGARLASANYGAAPNGAGRTAVLDTVRLSVEEALNGLRGNVTPTDLWVYEANTSGRPASTNNFTSCTSSCVRFTWDPVNHEFGTPTGTWGDPQACGVSLDRVGVYVRVRHDYLTPFLGTQKIVDEHSVMRIEPRNDC